MGMEYIAICTKVHYDGSQYTRSPLGSDATDPQVVSSPSADLTQVRVWDPVAKSWS